MPSASFLRITLVRLARGQQRPRIATATAPQATPTVLEPPSIAQTTISNPHTVTAQELIDEYQEVFSDKVKVMPGEKFKIHPAVDAKPFCVNAPRRIPSALRDKVKGELDDLLKKGIIVPVTEPTVWCAPIVVAPKKSSDRVRLCVDFSQLNRYVLRERYQSATPAECV